jgi:hypothetical protein
MCYIKHTIYADCGHLVREESFCYTVPSSRPRFNPLSWFSSVGGASKPCRIMGLTKKQTGLCLQCVKANKRRVREHARSLLDELAPLPLGSRSVRSQRSYLSLAAPPAASPLFPPLQFPVPIRRRAAIKRKPLPPRSSTQTTNESNKMESGTEAYMCKTDIKSIK